MSDYMIFVILWFSSFSTIISWSIHIATNDNISFFLWLTKILLYICTISSLSILLFVDEHLHCFHVLGILNSAALNIEMNVSFQLWLSPDICPGKGLLGHLVALCLLFYWTSILFSVVVVPMYIPINRVRGFPFLHTVPSFYCL